LGVTGVVEDFPANFQITGSQVTSSHTRATDRTGLTFTMKAPKTESATFSVNPTLVDGSQFIQGVYSILVVGTPTNQSTVACVGTRSGLSFVRSGEGIICTITAKDLNNTVTTGLASDFNTPVTSLASGAYTGPINTFFVDGGSLTYNLTAPTTTGDTLLTAGKLSAGNETFVQGSFTVTVVATPSPLSTVTCQGDRSNTTSVRVSEAVTCTITPKDKTDAVCAAVSEDFESPTTVNGTGLSAVIGTDGGNVFTFTATSPNTTGALFSLTTKLAAYQRCPDDACSLSGAGSPCWLGGTSKVCIGYPTGTTCPIVNGVQSIDCTLPDQVTALAAGTVDLTVVGTPTSATALACVGARSGTTSVRISEQVLCTLTARDGFGPTTAVAADFTSALLVGGTDLTPGAGVVGSNVKGTEFTFNATAPSTVGARFDLRGRLRDGSSTDAANMTVVGTPTSNSTVACVGARSGTTTVRASELVLCVITVKDNTPAAVTTGVTSDYGTPLVTGGASGITAHRLGVGGSTMTFNFTSGSALGPFNVYGTLSATNGGGNFTQGGFQLVTAGTPDATSTIQCVGDVSDALSVVRTNESITCTVTVNAGSSASTGVASDFGPAVVIGGSIYGHGSTTETLPQGGVVQGAGTGASSSMTFQVRAPLTVDTTFTVAGTLASGAQFSQGGFALTTAQFPDIVSFGINMNNVLPNSGYANVGVNAKADQGAILTVTFRAATNTTGFDVTKFTIADFAVGGPMAYGNKSYALTASTAGFDASDNASLVKSFILSQADTDALKLLQYNNRHFLSTRLNATHLHTAAGSNVADQVIETELLRSGTFPATTIVPDTTGPYLQSFALMDMATGNMTLLFNEPVDVGTLNISAFKLTSKLSAGATRHRLTPSSTTVASTGNTDKVHMVIGSDDLNIIKADSALCLFESSCFISFDDSAVKDLNGNPVVEIDEALQLSNVRLPIGSFRRDNLGAKLLNASMDLTANELILTFDEAVKGQASFDPTKVTLRSSRVSSQPSVTLTDSTTQSSPGTVLKVDLTVKDQNLIKAALLGSSTADTFIELAVGAVEDTALNDNGASNNNQAVTAAAAVQLDTFTRDSVDPGLVEFRLDLGLNALTLTFAEPMLVDQFNATKIVLSGNQYGNASIHRLTGTEGNVSGARTKYLTVGLNDADAVAIKQDDGIATLGDGSNLFIALAVGTLLDVSSNPTTVINASTAKQAAQVLADGVRANLLAYSIDMNGNTLKLTFDDVISTASLDPSAFEVQDAKTKTAGYKLSTNTTASSLDGRFITLDLGRTDRNHIKALVTVATGRSNTYLTMSAAALNDANDADVVAITDSNAIQAQSYNPDSAGEGLRSLTLDMNEGKLFLTFEEPMVTNTIVPELFTLQPVSVGSGAANLTLSNETTVTETSIDQVTFSIIDSDLNAIKNIVTLATGTGNSFVSFPSGFARDFANFTIAAEASTSAHQVDRFVPDTRAPEVNSFSIDLRANTLTLVFSETVDQSSLVATKLTLQNQQFSTQNHTLGGGTTASGHGTTIVINLDSNDVNAIKSNVDLADGQTSTFLSMAEGVVRDRANNSATAVTDATALSCPTGGYTTDNQGEALKYAALDMEAGTLVLTFEEPVKASSFDPTKVTIQSYANATLSSGTQVTLAASTSNPILSLLGTVATITLVDADLDKIKLADDLGVTRHNTYIGFGAAGIEDMSSSANAIATRSTESALQVASVTNDTAAPSLTSFRFALTDAILYFTFDEPMRIDTIVASKFTLQSTRFDNTSMSSLRKLTSLAPLTGEVSGRTIAFQLGDDDANAVRADTNLAAGPASSNTFLKIDAGAIFDMAGVGATPTNPDHAKETSLWTADAKRPSLTSFDFIMVNNQLPATLTLTFDETVKASSVSPEKLALMDMANVTGFHSGNKYTLSASSGTSNANGNVITITLLDSDVQALRSNFPLGIGTKGKTYLSTGTNAEVFITDMSDLRANQYLETAGLNVTGYSADMVPPEVFSFVLDKDAATLTLNFTEPINATEVKPSAFTLSGHANAPANTAAGSVTLSSSAVASSPSGLATYAVITIDSVELDALKSHPILAKFPNQTFLSVVSTTNDPACRDKAKYSLKPIASSAGKQAADVESDTTGPTLDAFSLDMDSLKLVLTFNEVVDVNTFNVQPSTLQLVSSASSSSGFMLTADSALHNVTDNSTRIVTVKLGTLDANRIKADLGLAVNKTTSYLLHAASLVTDVTGVNVQPRASPALQATTFGADQTAPTIDTWAFNANTGNLTLNFAETVDTVDPAGVVLQQSAGAHPSQSISLSGASIDKTLSARVVVTLTDTQRFTVLQSTSWCSQNDGSDCYITVANTTVTDMVGLSVIPVENGTAKVAAFVTPDGARPTLLQFSTFDLNNGKFVMGFSEPMNLSSFNPSSFRFQTEDINPESTYNLTGGTATGTNLNTVVTIKLSDTDLNAIKRDEYICSYRGTCHVAFHASAAADNADNLVEAAGGSGAIKVSTFVQDGSDPNLSEYTVDMQAEKISLTFDETIRIETFSPVALTLIAIGNSTKAYTLTDGTTAVRSAGDPTVIDISLSTVDVLALKAISGLAKNESETYLHFDSTLCTDMSVRRNKVTPVSLQHPKRVKISGYTADSTPPTLDNFELDLSLGTMTFSFNEPMVDTVVPTRLTLQQTANLTSVNVSLTLAAGTVASDTVRGAMVLSFKLSDADVKSLKLVASLASTKATTFLSAQAGSFRDMAYVDMTAIPVSSAKQAFKVTADETPSSLTSFDLNFETDKLSLTFTDVMASSTFDPTAIVLQNNTYTDGSGHYTLTASSTTSSASDYVVVVDLSAADVLATKKITGFAESLNTTYLRHAGDLLDDLRGTDVLSITDGNAIKATSFVADQTNPVLTRFALNLSTATIELKFSEAIDVHGLLGPGMNISQLKLQNSAGSSARRLTGYSELSVSSDETTLAFRMDSSDDLFIRGDDGMATGYPNTYINVGAGFINDFVQLPNNATVRQADAYVNDTVALTLLNYSVNLRGKSVEFFFSEVVRANVLDLTNATFQSASGGGVSYALSGQASRTIGHAGLSITATLLKTDFDAIMAIPELATDVSNTFLRFGYLLAADVTGNQITPGTQQAHSVTADNVKPELESFSIDLNTKKLVLTFSETMNSGSFNPTGVQIQSAANMSVAGAAKYVLSTATVFASNSTTLTVTLSTAELNAIKENAILATANVTTFISLNDTAFADMTGNRIIDIPADVALQATSFNTDTISPQLHSFHLNMHSGKIILTFTETVNASSLDPTKLTLHSSANASFVGVSKRQLTGDATASRQITPSTVVTVTMLNADTDAIKLDDSLGSNVSNVYISLTTAAIVDMSGRAVVAISSQAGLQALNVTRDTRPPALIAAALDMNSSTLLISFDEPTRRATLDVTALTLQSVANATAPNVAESVTLSSQSVSSSANGRDILISIHASDMNKVKAATQLARFANSTFVRLSSTLIDDMAGNNVSPATSDAAFQALEYTKDFVSPHLSSFTFNVSTAVLSLTFSETIQVAASKVNVSALVMQNSAGTPAASHRLTAATITENSPATTLTLTLSAADQSAIKTKANLGVSVDSTFLSLGPSAVADIEGNTAVEILQSGAKKCAQYGFDTIPPILTNFTINMRANTVTLTFSEVVSVISLDASKLFLDGGATPGANKVALSTSSSQSVNGTVVIVDLSFEDANALRRSTGIATSRATSYLTVAANAIRDMERQGVTPISTGIQADAFTGDTKKPTLQGANLNMDSGTLALTFSETVDAGSLDVSGVSLLSSRTAGTRLSLTTASNTSAVYTYSVNITIGKSDLDRLKLSTSLATGTNDTFVVMSNASVRDMANNAIAEITNGSAVQAGFVVSDTTSPLLESFDLDMNLTSPTMTLYFNEPVKVATLTAAKFELRSGAGGSASVYNLTTAFTSQGANGNSVAVTLAKVDVERLKADAALATAISTTYLRLISGAASDMNSRPMATSAPTQATAYVADGIAPQLLSFVIDLNATKPSITLSFDETVNATSVAVGGLTLLENKTAQAQAFTLKSSQVVDRDSTSVTISLSIDDLNGIKALDRLALNLTDTFLAATAAAAKDMAGNRLTAIASASALKATTFEGDIANPELAGFSLDMNSAQLRLVFTETVMPTTLNLSTLTIQNSISSPSHSHRLASAAVSTTSAYSTEVNVTLSDADVNAMKLLTSLATRGNNTFLVVDAALVLDMTGQESTAKSAVTITDYVPDQTGAILQSATVDLTNLVVTLGFDEPVLAADSQIDFAKVRLTNGSVAEALTSGAVLGSNAKTVQFNLSKTDADSIKLNDDIATFNASTEITLLSGAIKDLAAVGNGNEAGSIAGKLLTDTTSPKITSVAISMTLGTVTLQFDEPIRPSTFNSSLLHAQNRANALTNNTVALEGSTSSTNGAQLVVVMSDSTLNAIKADLDLYTTLGNSFISFGQGFVKDMGGNPISSVSSSSGVQAGDFERDNVSAPLFEYELNMNASLLKLHFNETMNRSSAKLHEIVLQKASGQSANQSLARSSTIASDDPKVITIKLHVDDLNDLKRKEIALKNTTTFLTMKLGAIRDNSENPSVQITSGINARPPAKFQPDATPPSIVSTSVDMNGVITISFNEIVRMSTADVGLVLLHTNASASDGTNFSLTSGSSSVDQANGLNLTVAVGAVDLNAIKLTALVGLSHATSFLTLKPGAVKDMSGNGILLNAGIVPTTFTGDNIAPTLSGYDFDIASAGSLKLTFSEPVDLTTLVPTAITFSSGTVPDVNHTLTGQVAPSTGLSREAVLNLNASDLNAIKTATALAVSNATTFIKVAAGMVTDRASNPLVQLATAKQVRLFTADITAPELTSFGLNVNSLTLSLTFTEAVDVSTLNVTKFTLQSSANISEGTPKSLTLSGGNVSTTNSHMVDIDLSKADGNNLKRLSLLGTNTASTYLSALAGAVRDMAALNSLAIGPSSAKRAVVHTADSTAPRLVAYSMNMNAGLLELTFSETVSALSLDITKFTLQDAASAGTGADRSFQAGTHSLMNSTFVNITLGVDDLNAVKLRSGTATQENNTYLLVGAAAVKDMNGRPIAAISNGAGQEATGFTPDKTQPTLDRWELNLETQVIKITFSEAIDQPTFNTSLITLHGNASLLAAADSRTLSNANITSVSADGTIVHLAYSKTDTEAIKQKKLCTSKLDCNLFVRSGLVSDMVGNKVVETPTTALQQAGFFTEDGSRPSLTEFAVFNMSSGTVTLKFSESVSASSVNISSLSFHSEFTDDSASTNPDNVKVSISKATVTSGDGDVLVFVLDRADLNAIKMSEAVCLKSGSCFIRFGRFFVTDLNKNQIIAVESTQSFGPEQAKARASSVVQDTSPPEIVSFSLSMNTGLLSLTFDEPVLYAEFVPKDNIVIQNTSSGGASVTLTSVRDQTVASYAGLVLNATLSTADMTAIKANADLATSHTNTFISMNAQVTTDTSPATSNGIANAPVSAGAAKGMTSASQFTSDSTPPNLLTFDSYNNGDGTFSFTFDEPVSLEANLTKVTFVPRNGNNYTLRFASTAAYEDVTLKTKLNFKISATDFNAIRLIDTLLTNELDSTVKVAPALVADVAGNPSVSTGSTPKAVGSYFADSISAQLTNFQLNMNEGIVSLTFNDVVDVSKMEPKHLNFQSSSSSADVPTPALITLTGGVSSSDDSYVLNLNITDDDLNTLKLNKGLATTANNTFISFNPLFIKDAAGSHIDSIDATSAQQAVKVTPDTTRPRLLEFHLNMNAGELSMTFTEAVETNFNLSTVTLHNKASGASSSIRMGTAQSITMSPLQTVMVAKLTQSNINTLTADPDIAVGTGSTFLEVVQSAVTDTNNQPLVAVPTSGLLQAANFTFDSTPPTLKGFEIDLDQKQIDITFSETVNVTSLDATKLTLLGAHGGIAHTLTGQTLLLTSPNTVVSFGIDPDDLDTIKLDDKIGTGTANTALQAVGGVVLDMTGNPSTQVVQQRNVTATTVSLDDTAPTLSTVILNLDNATLTLRFNEPVRVNTLRIPEVTFHDKVSSSTQTHTLTSGSKRSTSSVNSYEVTIDISKDDLDSLKRADALCNAKTSTFVTASGTAIYDMAGNNLTAVTKQATTYLPDVTDPNLVGFAVDMNASSLILNFDEPVRANTLSPTGITLLSKRGAAPSQSFVLTGGSTNSKNDLQIVVKLSEDDANAVKKNLALLTSNGTSFVAIDSGLVKDMANNSVVGIANASALPASSFKNDFGNPTLDAFSLNMSTSVLILTFSETMDTNTTQPTLFTLQTSSYASIFQQHTLTAGSTVITSADGLVIEIKLSNDDMDEMKSRLIGSTKDRTWLTVIAGGVKDTNARPLAAQVNGANALQVQTLGFDDVKPTLDVWDLDMTTGVMMLSFSEVIDERSVVIGGLALVAKNASGAASYTLTNSSLVCTACEAGYFELGGCSRGRHGSCKKCTACSGSHYYTSACNATADATCATCATCASHEFVSGPCTGFSDTVCTNCSTCQTNTYMTGICNATHNVQCKSCSSCAADEFLVSPCNATANTVCQRHATTCASGQYRIGVGNATRDTVCASCTVCPSGTYLQRPCTDASDAVCTPCSTPTAGLEYIAQTCSATHDAVLDVCNVCPGGNSYTKTACAGTNNTVCDTCSTCASGTFTSKRCTRTSNTVCTPCTANCDECGTQGTCNKCSSGAVRNLDDTCTTSCNAGSYLNGTVCMACHASCATCTGPYEADCSSCSNPNGFNFDPSSGGCARTDACTALKGSNRYFLNTSNICEQCADNCETCYGKLQTQCTKCYPGNITAGHACVTSCPDGYYDNGDPERCHQCPAHCAVCADSETCQVCDEGKFLVQGVCREVCPSPLEHGIGN
jgi:hypothetical protein